VDTADAVGGGRVGKMAPMTITFDDLLAGPCPPCRAGAVALEASAAAELLGALGHGWGIVGGRLVKGFAFPDFAAALAFVVRLGALSEEVGHHPEVTLGWGRVRIEIWTHAAGGLTRTDFAWAARAERLAAPAG
jgi:4a-hydroxytetrahydrobiopterin dehydratase